MILHNQMSGGNIHYLSWRGLDKVVILAFDYLQQKIM